METLKAREVLAWDFDTLFERLNDTRRLNMQFDNGEIHEVGGRKTILSWQYWDFHRLYPELPLNYEHHIGARSFRNKLHRELISTPMWQVFDTGISKDLNLLCLTAMRIFCNTYNRMSYSLEEYVTTITVLDYQELLDHPIIAQAKKDALPGTKSIEAAYMKISNVIMTAPELRNNAIAMACRADLISVGQVLQAVGPRGFPTDYDSNIFRKPIMEGYAEGFKSLLYSTMESRSGTKALKVTHEPLQKTEYFGRKTQLQNQYVQKLLAGDCGTTETVEFHITGKSLSNVSGKYHVLDDGSLEEITEASRHLVGKIVHLRSPLACRHRHKYGVCEKCAGTLSYSIPSEMYYYYPTVLGHMCAIALCSFVSQKVMSLKHEDGSSVAEELVIPEADAKYIKLNAGDSSKIQLQMDLKDEQLELIIPNEHIKYLEDINSVPDVTKLATTSLAQMSEILIRKTTIHPSSKKESSSTAMINTSVGPREASFTYEFLEYMQRVGWTVDDFGNYVVDLKQWRFSRPFLVMPQRHMNMLEYMESISKFIETKGKDKLTSCKTSGEALRKLYDIVNSRANVNILHLEVMLLSSIVSSRLHSNSNPPPINGSEETEFNVRHEIMFTRSMGAAMAFESHGRTLLQPTSYTNKNVPDHPFDAILGG